jgi:hypothetical protein
MRPECRLKEAVGEESPSFAHSVATVAWLEEELAEPAAANRLDNRLACPDRGHPYDRIIYNPMTGRGRLLLTTVGHSVGADPA